MVFMIYIEEYAMNQLYKKSKNFSIVLRNFFVALGIVGSECLCFGGAEALELRTFGMDIFGTDIRLYPSPSKPAAAKLLYNSSSYDTVQDLHIGPRDTDFDVVTSIRENALETNFQELARSLANSVAIYSRQECYTGVYDQICEYVETLDGQKFLGVPTHGIDGFCGLFAVGLDYKCIYYPELKEYYKKGLSNEWPLWQRIADDFVLNIHAIATFWEPDNGEHWSEEQAVWHCSNQDAKDLMDVYFQTCAAFKVESGKFKPDAHASPLIPLNEDRSVKTEYMNVFRRHVYFSSKPIPEQGPAIIGAPSMRPKPSKEKI
ncbi:MAG: hypothetical protein LBB25_01240 [Holosporaceae bacterium]|jgi:hypothetical protein|nr:hypothetical protein [Holosporaceae bacterium]